jgi:hypothetical protein
MNERIRELVKQAGIHFSNRGTLDAGPNGIAKFVNYSDIEKLSELIIQECLAVARQRLFTDYEGDSHRVAHNNAIWCSLGDIEEHFGVEE